MRLLFYFIISLLFCPDIAIGFPQNTRHGYASCQSCHVSPSGGGVLNAYGRMTSEELLSTWSYERESSVSHGLFNEESEYYALGGDFRTVAIRTENFYRRFNMQRDVELAVMPTKQLALVGTIGQYAKGEETVTEIRRHYFLYNLSDSLSFRAGKFFPSYGILVEDHSIATRRNLGWDQGKESYNLEASYKEERGEIFLTSIYGQELGVQMTPSDGYRAEANERGFAGRAALYLGKTSQLGASFFYGEKHDPDSGLVDRRRLLGGYAMVGLGDHVYFLAQHDWLAANSTEMLYWVPYGYDLFGVEVYKGVHLQTYYEMKDDLHEFGAKVQWFPRPHLEFTAQYEISNFGNVATFLAHYYL